jgi:hypothetical protein
MIRRGSFQTFDPSSTNLAAIQFEIRMACGMSIAPRIPVRHGKSNRSARLCNPAYTHTFQLPGCAGPVEVVFHEAASLGREAPSLLLAL